MSPVPQTSTNKPLPKIPKRGLCDFVMMDTRNSNKCILKRMRRVRLDAVLGDRSLAGTPSAYATARSAYVNPCEPLASLPSPALQQQTLQERRNPASVPQLTLPTTTESRTHNGMPMMWLADEQMWLVADPSDPGYGYYATGPEDGMDEWLPPYTEAQSGPSDPSSSDLSPVREQFMSLMDQNRQRGYPQHRFAHADEPRLSPLFQEAMQGVSMLDFSDYQVPSDRRSPSPDHRNSSKQSQSQSQRQYIPYRSFPHINAHSQQYASRTASQHQPSQKKADLYIPDLPTPPPSSTPNGISCISPSQIPPRSQSHALRTPLPSSTLPTINYSKYSSESEIRRQQERVERRRMHLEREQSRRDSCYSICSDSGVSTFSTAQGGLEVGPEPGFWGVQRASSARH